MTQAKQDDWLAEGRLPDHAADADRTGGPLSGVCPVANLSRSDSSPTRIAKTDAMIVGAIL